MKKRQEEVRHQNALMQKRLDEVTKKVRELENSTRELVSVVRVFLHVRWTGADPGISERGDCTLLT